MNRPGRRCAVCEGSDPGCSTCDGSGWIDAADDPLRRVADRWLKKIDEKTSKKSENTK